MSHPGQQGDFSTTQWSVVLEAAHVDPEKARAALQILCNRYWYPVYAFVRQKERDVHQAEDLTQSFFHFLLARKAFHTADPQKGRFRSFLLTSLVNFLHNEWDREKASKRGGRHEIVSLDEHVAEDIFQNEPAAKTPQQHFDQSWAAMLVRRVLDELRQEHEHRGKATLFAGLQPFLTGEPEPGAYERLGQQLEIGSGAVKVAVHRMRRRFGELLRREVAHTVNRPEDIEAELRELLAMIAS